jgi:hypothetical protein
VPTLLRSPSMVTLWPCGHLRTSLSGVSVEGKVTAVQRRWRVAGEACLGELRRREGAATTLCCLAHAVRARLHCCYGACCAGSVHGKCKRRGGTAAMGGAATGQVGQGRAALC